MSPDISTLFALLLAAVLGGLLAGIVAPWRRLISGGGLPVRRFAPHLAGPEALAATLRCALCAERARCARRTTLPAHCANRGLFGRR